MKFLRRIRKGEYSLQKTFWLYGVLAFIIAATIYSVVFTILKVIFRFDEIVVMYITTFIILLYALYQINLSIGLFNVAKKYKGNVIWKYGSLIISIYFLFLNVFNIFNSFNNFCIYSDIYKHTNKHSLHMGSLKSNIFGVLGFVLIIAIIRIIISMYSGITIYLARKKSYRVTANNIFDDEESKNDNDLYEDIFESLTTGENLTPSEIDNPSNEKKLSIMGASVDDTHDVGLQTTLIKEVEKDQSIFFIKTKIRKIFIVVLGCLSIILLICFSVYFINNFPLLDKSSDSKGGVTYGEPLTRKDTVLTGWWASYIEPTEPCVEFKKNAPIGFRKIEWGDTFKEHGSILIPASKDVKGWLHRARILSTSRINPHAGWEDQYDLYRVKNDKYKLGYAKVDWIFYSFTPDVGFVRADILYSGQDNIALIHNILRERWGESSSLDSSPGKDKHIAQWHNEDVIATVYNTGKDSEGLSIVSTKLTKQYVNLWTEFETAKDKKMENELKKGASEDF